MRAYWDNDAVHKLCAFDLTTEAMETLELDEVVVLPSCKYVFHASDAVAGAKKLPGHGVHWRVSAFLDGVAMDLSTVSDQKAVDKLSKVPNIDPGEAQLIVAAATDQDSVLVTGDKRCIKALARANTKSCRSIAKKLKGRVLCLELLLEAILDDHGFDGVCPRIVAAVHVDAAVKAVFGGKPTLDGVRVGLASYVREVRAVAAVLLWER